MTDLPITYAEPILGMRSGVALLDGPTWQRLQSHLVDTHDITHSLAYRIVDQAMIFLALCAESPHTRYSPSHTVDIGWDAFLRHTQTYVEWCEAYAGGYIHHHPHYADTVPVDVLSPGETAEALRQAGYLVDCELWYSDPPERTGPCYSGRHEKPPKTA